MCEQLCSSIAVAEVNANRLFQPLNLHQTRTERCGRRHRPDTIPATLMRYNGRYKSDHLYLAVFGQEAHGHSFYIASALQAISSTVYT